MVINFIVMFFLLVKKIGFYLIVRKNINIIYSLRMNENLREIIVDLNKGFI